MRDDFSNIIPLYEICIRCIREFPRDKKRQKSTKLNNLKQKKTNKTKTKQNLNEQIKESNRLRHMHHEGQLQIRINLLVDMGIGWNRFIRCTRQTLFGVGFYIGLSSWNDKSGLANVKSHWESLHPISFQKEKSWYFAVTSLVWWHW